MNPFVRDMGAEFTDFNKHKCVELCISRTSKGVWFTTKKILLANEHRISENMR